jgi:hypothetical protein
LNSIQQVMNEISLHDKIQQIVISSNKSIFASLLIEGLEQLSQPTFSGKIFLQKVIKGALSERFGKGCLQNFASSNGFENEMVKITWGDLLIGDNILQCALRVFEMVVLPKRAPY